MVLDCPFPFLEGRQFDDRGVGIAGVLGLYGVGCGREVVAKRGAPEVDGIGVRDREGGGEKKASLHG